MTLTTLRRACLGAILCVVSAVSADAMQFPLKGLDANGYVVADDDRWGKILGKPISLRANRPILLTDALHMVYLSGLARYQFDIILPDMHASVGPFHFINKPLAEVLDELTRQTGTRWMVTTDSILIYADMEQRLFSLDEDDLKKIELLESQDLLIPMLGTHRQRHYRTQRAFIGINGESRTLFVQADAEAVKRVDETLKALHEETLAQVHDRVYGIETRQYRVLDWKREEFSAFANERTRIVEEDDFTSEAEQICLFTMADLPSGAVEVRGLKAEVGRFTKELARKGLGGYFAENREICVALLVPPNECSMEKSADFSQMLYILSSLLYSDAGLVSANEAGRFWFAKDDTESGCVLTLVDEPLRVEACEKVIEKWASLSQEIPDYSLCPMKENQTTSETVLSADFVRREEQVIINMLDKQKELTYEEFQTAPKLVQFAQLFFESGKYALALAECDKIEKQFPDDAQALHHAYKLRMSYFLSQGRVEEVRAMPDRWEGSQLIFRNLPFHQWCKLWSHFGLAEYEMASERPAEARNEFRLADLRIEEMIRDAPEQEAEIRWLQQTQFKLAEGNLMRWGGWGGWYQHAARCYAEAAEYIDQHQPPPSQNVERISEQRKRLSALIDDCKTLTERRFEVFPLIHIENRYEWLQMCKVAHYYSACDRLAREIIYYSNNEAFRRNLTEDEMERLREIVAEVSQLGSVVLRVRVDLPIQLADYNDFFFGEKERTVRYLQIARDNLWGSVLPGYMSEERRKHYLSLDQQLKERLKKLSASDE